MTNAARRSPQDRRLDRSSRYRLPRALETCGERGWFFSTKQLRDNSIGSRSIAVVADLIERDERVLKRNGAGWRTGSPGLSGRAARCPIVLPAVGSSVGVEVAPVRRAI